MPTQSDWSQQILNTNEINWIAGSVSGIFGTVAFMLIQFAIGATGSMEMAIPAMYGIAGPALGVGAALHLIHGAVLGVLYASVVSGAGLRRYATTIRGGPPAGVAYGVLTTLVFAAVVMPLWLGAVGFPAAPPVPNFSLPSLGFHTVYGVVLGTVYALY